MNQTKETQNANEINFNWLDFVFMLLSNWYWLLISGIAAALAAFLLTSFFITPMYQSSVTFYVYNKSENSSSTPGTINSGDLAAAESLAETYRVMLSSNTILNAVTNELKHNELELTKTQLSKMVTTSVVNNTQILKITVTNADSVQAYEIAQAFAKVAPGEMIKLTNAGGVSVVDNAEQAKLPSSPNVFQNTAIGCIAGLLVCGVVLCIIMLADKTIYTPNDLEDIKGITILGQIPLISTENASDRPYTITSGGLLKYEAKVKE